MSEVVRLPARQRAPAPTASTGGANNVVPFTGPVRVHRAPVRRPTPVDWCADLDSLSEFARSMALIAACNALTGAIPEGGTLECRLGGARVPMTRQMAGGLAIDLIEELDGLLAPLGDDRAVMRRIRAAFQLKPD